MQNRTRILLKHIFRLLKKTKKICFKGKKLCDKIAKKTVMNKANFWRILTLWFKSVHCTILWTFSLDRSSKSRLSTKTLSKLFSSQWRVRDESASTGRDDKSKALPQNPFIEVFVSHTETWFNRSCHYRGFSERHRGMHGVRGGDKS